MSTYYDSIRFYGKSFEEEDRAIAFLKKHNIDYDSDSPNEANPSLLVLFYSSTSSRWYLGYCMDAYANVEYASEKWDANFRGEKARAMLLVHSC